MNNKNQDRVFINQNIKFPKVLCIDDNNANLGIIPTSQALALAQEVGLDLVQVAPPNRDKIPTVKIIDYGRFKFELSKNKKESDRKQRQSAIKEKELKFRPTTDLNDLTYKAKKAVEFLEEGCRVQLTMTFRGRESNHKEVGMETLEIFLTMVPNAQIISNPNFDGKNLVTVIVKKG